MKNQENGTFISIKQTARYMSGLNIPAFLLAQKNGKWSIVYRNRHFKRIFIPRKKQSSHNEAGLFPLQEVCKTLEGATNPFLAEYSLEEKPTMVFNWSFYPIFFRPELTTWAGFGFDISIKKKSEERIISRLRNGMCLEASAQSLLNNFRDPESFQEVLEHFIFYTPASGIVIYKASKESIDGLLLVPHAIHSRPGINPLISEWIHDIRNYSGLEYSEVRSLLENGQSASMGTFLEIPSERQSMETHKIENIILIPLRVSGYFWGAVGIIGSKDSTLLEFETTAMFHSIGNMIEVALEKAEKEEIIKRHNHNLKFQINEATVSLKNALESAEKANKAKSEFLASISHELRTPLNTILGFSKIIKLPETLVKEKEYIQLISSAGSHLLKMINELLDISKIEAGAMKFKISPLNVKSILETSVQYFLPGAQESGVTVQFQNDADGEPHIFADEGRIRQVLLNLLSNAVKFSKREDLVIVRLTANPGTIQIEIKDQGPGIEPKYFQFIFEKFSQIGSTLKSETVGTGLGLAITKKLVEAMDGKIRVESLPGEGSNFILTFPRIS